MRPTFCVESAEGVVVNVHVIPRSKRTAISGTREDALLVRLSAPPVEGAANDALVEFLASRLQVPRRAIRLLSGGRGRRKRIAG